MNIDSSRAAKLNKHLAAIIYGKQSLTRHNNGLFLEAIYTAPDAATCINKLIRSDKGLACLQDAMRFDLTSGFFNGPAAALLQYLSAPELTNIGGGDFLRQVLLAIVEPPIFWTSFSLAFKAGQLQENAQFCFAWLLLQFISLPGQLAKSHGDLAQDPAIVEALLTSPCHAIRSIAQKIKHIVATCSVGAFDDECGPGGRHDNDFVNFRDIAILPTEDELLSKKQAFLRPSTALDVPDAGDTLLATHLDNQFRLLREDMLYEMREELQIAFGTKKGKHRGFLIDRLAVEGIHHSISGDRRCKWGIVLRCHGDLWQFKHDNPKDRKAYLTDNRKILKHQSMTCLIIDDKIVAFPTLNRDEDLLAQKPPKIVLQLEGRKSTTKALLKLHTANHIKLLQIDTAIFSYEPILTALQEKLSLPLSPELLSGKKDSIMKTPLSQLSRIVEAIKANPCQNLQHLLNTTHRTELDEAQAASLLSGLTRTVSMIQGPPGISLVTTRECFTDKPHILMFRHRKVVHRCTSRKSAPRHCATDDPSRLLYKSCSRPVPWGSSRYGYTGNEHRPAGWQVKSADCRSRHSEANKGGQTDSGRLEGD